MEVPLPAAGFIVWQALWNRPAPLEQMQFRYAKGIEHFTVLIIVIQNFASLPSRSDIFRYLYFCQASAINCLPINLCYINKRVPYVPPNHSSPLHCLPNAATQHLICLKCKLYLYKLQNIFVKNVKYIGLNRLITPFPYLVSHTQWHNICLKCKMCL